MSVYTTEVRYICESLSGLTESTGINGIDNCIKLSIPKIFEDFPIFDENYRETLETKILKHFYFREIGFETFALWKFKLNEKLNLIMPYYNKLYLAEKKIDNPLNNVDYTINRTGNDNINRNINSNDAENNTQSTTTTNTGKSTEKNSNTPQGSIQDLEAGNYMSGAAIIDNNQNSNQNANFTGNKSRTENNTENRKSDSSDMISGVNGSKNLYEILKGYSENIVNIDLLVMESLEDLFMQIW